MLAKNNEVRVSILSEPHTVPLLISAVEAELRGQIEKLVTKWLTAGC